MPLHRPTSSFSSSIYAGLFMVCLGLAGCAALNQTSSEVAIREPGDRLLGNPRPAWIEAQKSMQFAWLSQAAYGNTAAGQTETAKTGPANCPESQASLFAAGWRVWPGFPSDGLQQQIDKYHLRVEVWTRQQPPSVAVAFGGTVLDNQNDWASNFRWFLPKWFLAGHPDEYSTTVQMFGPAFIKEFKEKLQSGASEWAFLKDAKIYSTGHSLGGGLAQQFAYALPLDDVVQRVSHVYAFDPSPVTGFYSVDADVRDHNRKTLFIDRIYERGEVLAVVRSMTSVMVVPSKSEPTIRGVRFALFYPSTPIAGHSMTQLTCKLYEAAKS